MRPLPIVQPLRLRSLEPGTGHRRVTWLELFFDLVFVASVSHVAAPLRDDYSPAGLLRFAALFLLIWWAWFGHTLFATRFDTDDVLQRALTLLQMFVVAVMGINTSSALASRDSAGFAAAYAVLRFILVAQYLRAARLGPARPVSTIYLAGCTAAAALWLASALVPVDIRFGLWTLAFAIDAATCRAGAPAAATTGWPRSPEPRRPSTIVAWRR